MGPVIRGWFAGETPYLNTAKGGSATALMTHIQEDCKVGVRSIFRLERPVFQAKPYSKTWT
jgi:hypothetical protein